MKRFGMSSLIYQEELEPEWSVPPKPLGEIFEYAPSDWANLPVTIDVFINTSETGCVNQQLFLTQRRDTVVDALMTIYEPRIDHVLIGYRVRTVGVTPLLPYEFQSPISRQSKLYVPGLSDPDVIDAPWNREASRTLFILHQHLPGVGFFDCPPAYGEPVRSITASGRTAGDSINRYRQLAKIFRKLREVV